MSVADEIIHVLEGAGAEIRSNMASNNINASGRTSASIVVESTGSGWRLKGGGKSTAPIPTVEVGRQGGSVPKGFYQVIKQWTKDKGLSFGSERERSTFSYFVARKIAREGTERHKAPVDVYSTVVNDAVGSINTVLNNYVSSEIRKALGRTATVTSAKTHF